MNVYFARSLRGARVKEDRKTYKFIADTIETYDVLTMKTSPIARLPDEEWDEFVYRRDLDWMDRSDCMIAEVTSPSHGVGYEFAYAKHVRKMPIWAVAEKDTHVSAMLRFAAPIFYYRDWKDLGGFIEETLRSYAIELVDTNRDEGGRQI